MGTRLIYWYAYAAFRFSHQYGHCTVFVGIIDILQAYTTAKKAEHKIKWMRCVIRATRSIY